MIPRQHWTEDDLAKHLQRMARVGNVKSAVLQNTQHPSASLDRSSPYRSKWEAAFASKLEMEKRTNHVQQYWYEPFSLWLPGKIRFKPDFLVQYADNVMLEIIEVKGWSKNRRDGITRLKIAAVIYSCFVWRMVYRTKNGGWDGEYL